LDIFIISNTEYLNKLEKSNTFDFFRDF